MATVDSFSSLTALRISAFCRGPDTLSRDDRSDRALRRTLLSSPWARNALTQLENASNSKIAKNNNSILGRKYFNSHFCPGRGNEFPGMWILPLGSGVSQASPSRAQQIEKGKKKKKREREKKIKESMEETRNNLREKGQIQTMGSFPESWVEFKVGLGSGPREGHPHFQAETRFIGNDLNWAIIFS